MSTTLRLIASARVADEMRALVVSSRRLDGLDVSLIDQSDTPVSGVTVEAPTGHEPLLKALEQAGHYVAHCRASPPAGQTYRWRVLAPEPSGQISEALSPELPDLRGRIEGGGRITLNLGSCYYAGFGCGEHYADAARRHPWFGVPDLQLLVGDNLYLDIGKHYAWRMGAYRSVAEAYLDYFVRDVGYGRVLSQLPTLLTWDDHDLWNDFPRPQPHLIRSWRAVRRPTYRAALSGLDVFQVFLAPDTKGWRRSYRFDLAPFSFYVADLRTHRERPRWAKGGLNTAHLMDPLELSELVEWIGALTGPGVLVIGQSLWLERGAGLGDRTPANYPQDFEKLWGALQAAKHDVVILTGDLHYSRVLCFPTTSGNKLLEIASSPGSGIPGNWGSFVTNLLGRQSRRAEAHPKLAKGEDIHRLCEGVVPREIAVTTGDQSYAVLVLEKDESGGGRLTLDLVEYDAGGARGAIPMPRTFHLS